MPRGTEESGSHCRGLPKIQNLGGSESNIAVNLVVGFSVDSFFASLCSWQRNPHSGETIERIFHTVFLEWWVASQTLKLVDMSS
jgi:hypothetical protein